MLEKLTILSLTCIWVIFANLHLCHAQEAEKPRFSWRNIEQGYDVGRYALNGEQYFLHSEVLLLRFDPQFFIFTNVLARVLEVKRSNIKKLSDSVGGIAGINTNFFDEFENPLGLIVENGKQVNRMHEGGSLLTGVFTFSENTPRILHRSKYRSEGIDLAFQAGPRLIEDGRALRLKLANTSSRRSGIAVTKDGKIIIYATLLRFPGASLRQIQDMLLDKRLDISDALNLDGGGSSQLFIKKNKALVDDTIVSGGDSIPVALVIKKK